MWAAGGGGGGGTRDPGETLGRNRGKSCEAFYYSDYTHPDDHNLPNYDMTPGFKPFTVIRKGEGR